MPTLPQIATNSFILGFDFGMKHLGIAVGQPLTRSATALKRIAMQQGEPHWPTLTSIVAEWQPAAFVVGIPLNMDGSKQALTVHADAFMQQLQDHFHLPTFGVDERLSSYAAKEQYFNDASITSHKKRRRPSQIDTDSLAAKVILETWLRDQT